MSSADRSDRMSIKEYLEWFKNLKFENQYMYTFLQLMGTWLIATAIAIPVCVIWKTHFMHETIVGLTISYVLGGLTTLLLASRFMRKFHKWIKETELISSMRYMWDYKPYESPITQLKNWIRKYRTKRALKKVLKQTRHLNSLHELEITS